MGIITVLLALVTLLNTDPKDREAFASRGRTTNKFCPSGHGPSKSNGNNTSRVCSRVSPPARQLDKTTMLQPLLDRSAQTATTLLSILVPNIRLIWKNQLAPPA